MNISTSLVAQLVAVIYGFVLPRLILEQFGSEVNGLTQSIKQFLGIITFLDLGLGQVVRSALYRPLAQKDRDSVSRIMASGRKFYRRIAYVLTAYVIVLMVVYPFLAEQSFGWMYTATLIAAMAVSSFAQYYFGLINEQLLHADQNGYVIYSLQIVTHIANILICVLLINNGFGIHAVKLAASLVYLIRPAVIQLFVRRKYRIDRKITYEKEPIAQKWSGVAQHVSAVILDGTDTIVLTLFSTLANVSVYSVYYMVIASLQQFYQSATAGIQSAAGALWARDDRDAQRKMFSYVQTLLHFVTVFLFTCAGILIVPFIQVYTAGLTDAVYIQPLFSLLLVTAYGIRCLRTPYNIWILAAGHYGQTQKCHITAAAVNLVVSVIAVTQWGLVGVAVGTLVAMVYQTGWMAMYNTRNLLNWPLKDILKQFAADILVAGLTVLACRGFTMAQVSYQGWFVLAVKVALTALAVMLAAMLLLYRDKISGILALLVGRKARRNR